MTEFLIKGIHHFADTVFPFLDETFHTAALDCFKSAGLLPSINVPACLQESLTKTTFHCVIFCLLLQSELLFILHSGQCLGKVSGCLHSESLNHNRLAMFIEKLQPGAQCCFPKPVVEAET